MRPPPSADYPRTLLDRMVRSSLSDVDNLADLLRAVRPEAAALLDLPHAEPVPRDFFTGDWHLREADLPFTIPLLASVAPEGRRVLVFVLMEHQSETDPVLPLRMLFCVVGYWARQWQQWMDTPVPRGPLRLSPVLPIVLYTADRPWGSNTDLTDLLDGPEELHAFAPAFDPLFWNLSEQPPEALLAGGPWLQFLAVVRVQEGAWEVFRASLEGAGRNLSSLAEQQAARWSRLLRMIFEYSLWCRPEAERTNILDVLTRTNPTRTQEVQAMSNTIAANIIQQGEQRGELRESRQALRDVVEGKFGSVPEDLARGIEACVDLAWLRDARRRVFHMKDPTELTPPAPPQ